MYRMAARSEAGDQKRERERLPIDYRTNPLVCLLIYIRLSQKPHFNFVFNTRTHLHKAGFAWWLFKTNMKERFFYYLLFSFRFVFVKL